MALSSKLSKIGQNIRENTLSLAAALMFTPIFSCDWVTMFYFECLGTWHPKVSRTG